VNEAALQVDYPAPVAEKNRFAHIQKIRRGHLSPGRGRQAIKPLSKGAAYLKGMNTNDNANKLTVSVKADQRAALLACRVLEPRVNIAIEAGGQNWAEIVQNLELDYTPPQLNFIAQEQIQVAEPTEAALRAAVASNIARAAARKLETEARNRERCACDRAARLKTLAEYEAVAKLPLMPETISETVDGITVTWQGYTRGNPFCEILEGYYVDKDGSSYRSDLSDINQRIAAIRNASEAELDEANRAARLAALLDIRRQVADGKAKLAAKGRGQAQKRARRP
jgi:hypothetical protein